MPETTAKRADLYKMHTYRDALGVRAAVVVYPGETCRFYSMYERSISPTLHSLLIGELSGVGVLTRKPDSLR
jgi:hypothetical protein